MFTVAPWFNFYPQNMLQIVVWKTWGKQDRKCQNTLVSKICQSLETLGCSHVYKLGILKFCQKMNQLFYLERPRKERWLIQRQSSISCILCLELNVCRSAQIKSRSPLLFRVHLYNSCFSHLHCYYPFGCPVAPSVSITILPISPQETKWAATDSFEAAKCIYIQNRNFNLLL